MPNITETAIKESFLKLLDKQPLKIITVKKVTDSCGIKRNSFYYYFKDIPSLLDSVLGEKTNEVIKAHPFVSSVDECRSIAADFVLQNKRSVLNIYRSNSFYIFEEYLQKMCGHFISLYFNESCHNAEICGRDRDMVIQFHKQECFSLIVEWLKNGMNKNIDEYRHRIYS